LLDATRLDRGQLPIEPETIDLGALVEASVTQYGSELERAGCDVTLHLAPDLVGSWDPVRLEQVVLNLLSNAAKFGARKPIAVRLVREDDVAKLSVADHGIGIAPAHQGRIFERDGAPRSITPQARALEVLVVLAAAHYADPRDSEALPAGWVGWQEYPPRESRCRMALLSGAAVRLMDPGSPKTIDRGLLRARPGVVQVHPRHTA